MVETHVAGIKSKEYEDRRKFDFKANKIETFKSCLKILFQAS